MTPSMTSTRATLRASRWCTRMSVSWVIVKTKTRSKNSSSVETRIADSVGGAGAAVSVGSTRSNYVREQRCRDHHEGRVDGHVDRTVTAAGVSWGNMLLRPGVPTGVGD